jgi:hypothetical protein
MSVVGVYYESDLNNEYKSDMNIHTICGQYNNIKSQISSFHFVLSEASDDTDDCGLCGKCYAGHSSRYFAIINFDEY